jgi:predicted ATPase
VGREEELDLLLRRWSQAKDGEGQVVLLSGEPGIVKSGILSALGERLVEHAEIGRTSVETRQCQLPIHGQGLRVQPGPAAAALNSSPW